MDRLGVLATHPIQYQAPLYRLLAERRRISVDVLYLNDSGHVSEYNAEFGIVYSWNLDLLSGYPNSFLSPQSEKKSRSAKIRGLVAWIRHQDVVVVHGYSHPWMVLAMLICVLNRVPYLLRGDSQPLGTSGSLLRYIRALWVRLVVHYSGGCLAIGKLNTEFCRQYGARKIYFAPFSVDDRRFARPPVIGSQALLRRWNVRPASATVIFSGKLSARKRPLDVLDALDAIDTDISVLFVGDGPLASEIKERLARTGRNGAVTGFVNQQEIPSYYHAADILVLPSEIEKWGLVVNEAMAAGVLPVVSDRVGAGPDLVRGSGEVYACGDPRDLADALRRALARLGDTGIRDRMRQAAIPYGMVRTAEGFESAVLSCAAGKRRLRGSRACGEFLERRDSRRSEAAR